MVSLNWDLLSYIPTYQFLQGLLSDWELQSQESIAVFLTLYLKILSQIASKSDISSKSFLVTTMSSTYTMSITILSFGTYDEYSVFYITLLIPESYHNHTEPIKSGSGRFFKPYNVFFNLHTLPSIF